MFDMVLVVDTRILGNLILFFKEYISEIRLQLNIPGVFRLRIVTIQKVTLRLDSKLKFITSIYDLHTT